MLHKLTEDATLHAANLLACAGTLAAAIEPATAATTLAASALSIKEITKCLPPKAHPIAQRLRADLATQIQQHAHHFQSDAAILVPQMIEAALPDARTIIDTGQKPDLLLAEMERRLKAHAEIEYRDPANLAPFKRVMQPVLNTLLADPAFTAQLAPLREQLVIETNALVRAMHADLQEIKAALQDPQIATRDQLEVLALRFEIDGIVQQTDADLRDLLTKKAEEYHALKAEVDAIPDSYKRLSNLKAAAQDAIDRVDLIGVEELMAQVHSTELEEAAKSAEIRANNALLRGNVAQAAALLASAADSFGAVDPVEPARRKAISYCSILYAHGLRFGGDGLGAAIELVEPIIGDNLQAIDASLWAAAQNNLAIALKDQAARTDGAESTRLLEQAVTAYRAALEVRTREDHRVEWAMTQNNLAIALRDQADRTEGAESARLLDQAVTAYRAALEVHTRNDHPVKWATTQNNLAIALGNQADRTEGAEGARLLDQAVTAYRDALEVYTRNDHPVDWAMTQNNLAIALSDQAARTDGAEGARLLDQAVTAYRAALEVRTRKDHPVYWAMTQNNLAIALRNQAARTDGAEGTRLLDQAVTAYRDALEVYTRNDHPVKWATTQNNLAIALGNQADRTDGAEGARLLDQAVTAYRDALEVRTRKDHPVDWAMTQNNLATALCNQAARTDGAEGARLLDQAVTAYRDALEVRTRKDHPVEWAHTQENIAIAERVIAKRNDCPEPAAALNRALAAVDAALTVFDPVHLSYNYGGATRLRDGILADIESLS